MKVGAPVGGDPGARPAQQGIPPTAGWPRLCCATMQVAARDEIIDCYAAVRHAVL
ncbi:hypothetical protein SY2F82_14290 [Streptomyces sp. Y2F8-2]|uniref:hypothetical protein n=1 Tax=Streptomyces sp. Y2F8-2 TaxID=2759675 RepID=UPI001903DE04|nr:hypothetical protein [Streptomyces sp. Y2F8-2]GHJ99631.1 hypothetical protein SY2F82_14290 [Streptomyces sp. Y2F8-2]